MSTALARALRSIEIGTPAPRDRLHAVQSADALIAELAAIRPPAAVRNALEALEAARQLMQQRSSELRDAVDAARRQSGSVLPQRALMLQEAAEAATRTRDRCKTELHAAIAAWAPDLRRVVQRHRQQAAAEIVAAVAAIEAGLRVVAACDETVRRWGVEPAPALLVGDMQALRRSAERIAEAAR